MKIGLRTDEVKSSPWAEILAFLKLNGTTGAKKLKTLFQDLDVYVDWDPLAYVKITTSK